MELQIIIKNMYRSIVGMDENIKGMADRRDEREHKRNE